MNTMNQTARYIIMVLLIIALAIWSITVYRSCQETKQPVDLPEDTSTDIDTGDLEDLYAAEEDTTADEFVDTGADLDTEEDETPDNTFTAEPEPDDEGEFLVIAGAYIVEANAKKVVNRLNQQGYNAEIRVFIGSEYHSVIVGAYEGMDDAFDVAIKLADADYKDIYVHKKRYRERSSS
jgi:cell division protein FtsN